MSPCVSLIVSLYEQHWAIPYTLPSIAQQDCPVPFEVIICDDGSTQLGLQALRACPEHRSMDIKYVWQPDIGFRLSRSRNNGIRCARGEVLVFVDGDSWLSPHCLSDHWQAHLLRFDQRRLVAGSRSHARLKAGNDEATWRQVSHGDRCVWSGEANEQRQWLGTAQPWMACVGGNFSVRRGEEVYFDEGFEGWGSEDRDVALRLYQAGYEVVMLGRPNAVHLDTDGPPRLFTHDDIVATLKGKLRLREKHSWETIENCAKFVRLFSLDRDTGRWSRGPARLVTSNQVLDEFEKWVNGDSPAESLALEQPAREYVTR